MTKTTKLISTLIALPLHMAVGFLMIGAAQREFGGPTATEFPYFPLLLLTLAPLLVSIWSTRATFWRRMGAWAVGTTVTVASFIVLHPVALKAFAWDAAFGDPYSLGAIWPLAGVAVGALLLGILAARIVLRSKRGTTSSRSPV